MAKNDGATEKATPQRRKKSREEGQVLKSKDVSTFFSLLAFSIVLIVFGPWFVKEMAIFQLMALDLIAQNVTINEFIKDLGYQIAKLFLPFVIIGLVFIAVDYLIQVRFLFSMKIIVPKLKRINPVSNFKSIFEFKKSSFQIVKSLAIVIALVWTVYSVLRGEILEISSSMFLNWKESIVLLWGVFVEILIKILIVLLIIGVVDWLFQRMQYENQIKMKKEEVKDERKQNDGSPEVKARQRQVMREILKRDITQKTPESDFLITNPTHYAIAIRYNKELDDVPRVIVKGVDELALYMKDIAKNNDIPIHEDPPFAREIYERVKEDEYIPQDLYVAIVKILKYLVSKKKIKIE